MRKSQKSTDYIRRGGTKSAESQTYDNPTINYQLPLPTCGNSHYPHRPPTTDFTRDLNNYYFFK